MDDEGHLSDTSENRETLRNLANDKSKYVGTDSYGNECYAELLPDGSQIWCRVQNGVINEGGKNNPPRSWNPITGFNNNPPKWRKKNEK